MFQRRPHAQPRRSVFRVRRPPNRVRGVDSCVETEGRKVCTNLQLGLWKRRAEHGCNLDMLLCPFLDPSPFQSNQLPVPLRLVAVDVRRWSTWQNID